VPVVPASLSLFARAQIAVAMGQAINTECSCNDGLFNMCAPQDPDKEAQTTLRAQHTPSAYPAANNTSGSEGPTYAAVVETPVLRQASDRFAPDEFGDCIAAPPPPAPADNRYAPFPPDNGGAPPPPYGGAPHPAQNYPPMHAQSSAAARQDVSADDILSNLEGSEEVTYSEAFASFPGGLNGFVGLDCAVMRDFLCTNSCISMDDIDMELLKVAEQDMSLSRDGFLSLLRDFSVNDGDVISHFMGLSANGESLAAEETRSGLLLFAQQKLNVSNFSDSRWECIFNTVMWDAGVTVSMEQFMNYCKLTSRMVRLLRFVRA